MNKIAIVGTGYVGLVTGSCLSDFGLNITCVDNDKNKIDNLHKGIIPIYEPGLEPIVERNVYYKRLSFTTEIKEAVNECDVVFIAVGTPPAEDGSADLQYVESVARDIGKHMNGYKVIVDKSTVPIGTGKKVKAWVREELEKRGVSYNFDVVSNPEFLREGSAVHDFTHPDRVVIGAESKKAMDIMKQVYSVLYLNETPFIETNIETAEMIKYASNAFLAMKITFINEVANLCEKVGSNVQDVAKAMGRDGRISPKFLNPGPGYGGSCFPKDTLALAEIGKQYNSPVTLIEQTVEANEYQKKLMAEKIENTLGDLKDKQLAILGLAFKPNTDDMREAPSITILNELAKKGAKFKVYDPIAYKEAKWRLENIQDKIIYCDNEYEAMENSDALVIITEWNQFRKLDLDRVKESLKQPYFFDFRNIYRKDNMEKQGLKYIGVGQGIKSQHNLEEYKASKEVAATKE
ncbi:UDP-glucose dehydrogenase family protein [Clostridium cochlearium]|uniref:UDP-glucose dehydrogenase family protein n=1 Tax=Clostridium cochlearium TaxID=1494 RepID=UPI00156F9919|nr:UDP-glucose/GDP-mannose dehydrogenase family protein [Clostridium cochlearium]MBV1817947.1 UDP-glucose/GDP-mannose dehydrogenase family protein [Bacteroidales bacterium MSK.15.36]MCG4571362.1 UDP-glucose/GDP-mannose dehydrogenase family protein [Clostridium cochlearium]MCG4579997.1 UDP-glucose/GDP-mannose dehydrogenase family protein [Clostridium cochlearium]NSJ90603.1 UDP-glucose/GDP-mannose dehydrogenase family protein [Coprococcus sp. MSK.21.13]